MKKTDVLTTTTIIIEELSDPAYDLYEYAYRAVLTTDF